MRERWLAGCLTPTRDSPAGFLERRVRVGAGTYWLSLGVAATIR